MDSDRIAWPACQTCDRAQGQRRRFLCDVGTGPAPAAENLELHDSRQATALVVLGAHSHTISMNCNKTVGAGSSALTHSGSSNACSTDRLGVLSVRRRLAPGGVQAPGPLPNRSNPTASARHCAATSALDLRCRREYRSLWRHAVGSRAQQLPQTIKFIGKTRRDAAVVSLGPLALDGDRVAGAWVGVVMVGGAVRPAPNRHEVVSLGRVKL
jgi:hypothetical protein